MTPSVPCLLVAVSSLAPLAAHSESDSTTRATLARADAIDQLVDSALERRGATLPPLADDVTFLRRAYLAIAGRVPTLEEQQAFAGRPGSDRRATLIQDLLESPAHASAELHWWADLFRAKSKLSNRVSGEPFLHWIRQALVDNRPYDEMVREMLTAVGPAHARGNGATGLVMRDAGMPEDGMSNVTRVFLGTRLECAQCHDHPFDRWTRREYYEMVAFWGGIEYRSYVGEREGDAEDLREFVAEVKEREGRVGRQAVRNLFQPLSRGIGGTGTGLVPLPEDYQYKDGAPHEWIGAQPLFGDARELAAEIPEIDEKKRKKLERRLSAEEYEERMTKLRKKLSPEDVGSRDAFADWVTAKENERFTRVIANRLWKKAFGAALIEPVDDLRDDTEAVEPELLAHLERLMRELNYDVRAFQAVLYNTRTWQAALADRDATPGEPHDLLGPLLRRMSAEELWDSILTFVLEDVDATLAESVDARAENVYERYESILGATEEELWERVALEVLRYKDKPAFKEETKKLRAAERAMEDGHRDEVKAKKKELARAKKKKQKGKVARLTRELGAMGVDPKRNRKRERALKGLVRASELASPAPPGHFLREFGQSDRETIEAATVEATAPQVLALLNGFLEERVLVNPEAHLLDVIRSAASARERVDLAFRAVLGREPTGDERALWEADVDASPKEGVQDLLWTLINTHEFLFVR